MPRFILDDVVAGYVRTALYASSIDGESAQVMLHEHNPALLVSLTDQLRAATRLRDRCASFLAENRSLLASLIADGTYPDYQDIGSDLAFTLMVDGTDFRDQVRGPEADILNNSVEPLGRISYTIRTFPEDAALSRAAFISVAEY